MIYLKIYLHYSNIKYSQLNALDKATAVTIGLTEFSAVELTKGKTMPDTVQRFFLTLILYMLWQKKSVHEIAKMFSVHRGIVQSLAAAASSYSLCIMRFCKEINSLATFTLGAIIPKIQHNIAGSYENLEFNKTLKLHAMIHPRNVASFVIQTGSHNLNKLLAGGIKSGHITEFYGESGAGKSQMCHTLAITAQLSGHGKCMFIDTEGTFRTELLLSIGNRFGLKAEEVLENITYARAYSSDHQIHLLHNVPQLMAQTPYSVFILDSPIRVFRIDYPDAKNVAPRQNMLGRFLSMLLKVAKQYNVAVVITNQVYGSIVNNQEQPLGGNVMAIGEMKRLQLKKRQVGQRMCTTDNGQSCNFFVTGHGVADSSD